MTATDDSLRDLLRDTANRMFQDLCTPAASREAETGMWPASLWSAVEEAGLPRALVPEAAGGSGVSFADGMVIARAAGRFALPLPLVETMLAGWLLARAGLPVPEGPMTIAFGDTVAITPDGHLTGRAARVPWAGAASTLVAMSGDGRVAIVPAAARSLEAGHNAASEPRETVRFDGTASAAGLAGLDTVQLRAAGAAMRAHQIAGALERITEMTVQYAQDRVQFGRPLGKFQAVQQNLAVLAGQTAAACAAADMAGEAVDQGIRLPAIAAGKARCGEAAGIGAAIAHQVHGAIGFTHEHSLHFLTKRLWSWRDEFGNETVWNRLLGHHMAQVGAESYWAEITAAA
jgi:alkylation response protein AidB-like acyl-CoA dehydrogenase